MSVVDHLPNGERNFVLRSKITDSGRSSQHRFSHIVRSADRKLLIVLIHGKRLSIVSSAAVHVRVSVDESWQQRYIA